MAPAPIKIIQQLPEEQKRQTAKLYFEAFGSKFIHMLNIPDNAAMAESLFVETLNFDCGHYAVQGKTVLGAAALLTKKESFDHMSFAALRKHFPLFGAAWRAFGYWGFELIHTKPKDDEVLIDALFVSSETRGMGIGTLLLQHAEDYARSIGRTKLILGVINTNEGAKRLYERFGFKVFKYENTGWFSARAGFTGAYHMRKDLD